MLLVCESPKKEVFRVFFAAGNMWDISDETCQLIFYKTFHTSFSASCLFVFWVSSSCGKYNYLATLAKNGRSLSKNFFLTLYEVSRRKNQKKMQFSCHFGNCFCKIQDLLTDDLLDLLSNLSLARSFLSSK